MLDLRTRFSCIVILIWTVLFPGSGQAQQTFRKEIYQDFRGKRRLLDEFKLVGPDHEEAITPEVEGLRITLPMTRKANLPTGVRLQFPLAGDFEITAAYEILAIEKPPSGGGVGIAFNLIAQPDQRKMVKLGRFQLPQQGNAYVAECWNKDQPTAKPYFTMPTEAKAGQLRITRNGTQVRCLVEDEPANVFREIYSSAFTAEDLEVVRLGANTNGSPAGIDVRLVDLRIRYDAAAPVPPVAVRPADVGDGANPPPRRGVLTIVLFLGFGTIVVLTLGLGGWIYLRRRRVDA